VELPGLGSEALRHFRKDNLVYFFGSFLEILKSWGGTMKSTMSPTAATSTKRRKS